MTTTTKRITGLVVFPAGIAVTGTEPVRAAQAGKSPVKVFILAGQSNMLGAGTVEGDKTAPQRE